MHCMRRERKSRSRGFIKKMPVVQGKRLSDERNSMHKLWWNRLYQTDWKRALILKGRGFTFLFYSYIFHSFFEKCNHGHYSLNLTHHAGSEDYLIPHQWF